MLCIGLQHRNNDHMETGVTEQVPLSSQLLQNNTTNHNTTAQQHYSQGGSQTSLLAWFSGGFDARSPFRACWPQTHGQLHVFRWTSQHNSPTHQPWRAGYQTHPVSAAVGSVLLHRLPGSSGSCLNQTKSPDSSAKTFGSFSRRVLASRRTVSWSSLLWQVELLLTPNLPTTLSCSLLKGGPHGLISVPCGRRGMILDSSTQVKGTPCTQKDTLDMQAKLPKSERGNIQVHNHGNKCL